MLGTGTPTLGPDIFLAGSYDAGHMLRFGRTIAHKFSAMSRRSVTVKVPATSANLGPGFDCLGLALDLWGTVSIAVAEDSPANQDAVLRMALDSSRRVFAAAKVPPPPLTASYDGVVPMARGLGASAILRVGGLLGANFLLGEPFQRDRLLTFAADLERHADNAAPALFGGLQVAVRPEGSETVLHVGVCPPPGLKAVLFIPEFHMPTAKSREVLPAAVTRANAIYNIGRASLLVAALATGELGVLDEATQDKLHQPARAGIFPAMPAIIKAARAAGAHCAYLSGGGSTICALTSEREDSIAEAMAEAAARAGVRGTSAITRPTERGAEVIEGG